MLVSTPHIDRLDPPFVARPRNNGLPCINHQHHPPPLLQLSPLPPPLAVLGDSRCYCLRQQTYRTTHDDGAVIFDQLLDKPSNQPSTAVDIAVATVAPVHTTKAVDSGAAGALTGNTAAAMLPGAVVGPLSGT